MEYVPSGKPRFASVSDAKKKADEGVSATVKVMFNGSDIAAEVTREYLCNNFIYAANRIPEICENIVGIDNAMKWGYNHELGPFETWDAVGVREAVEVMKKLKKKVPKKIEEMLKKGFESFYVKKEDGRYFYDFEKKDYVKLEANPRIIRLPDLKEQNKVVRKNASATLVDIGDGVACLEFHTKMNAVDDGMIEMIHESCCIVEKDFIGMVVGNHGTNFSAGANIFKVLIGIQRGDWDIIEKSIAGFQNANMRMKYLSKPVVSAPAGLALGGGCEMAMHAAKCQPCGETYIGLVEVGVGVIPAGGGCKELMVRMTEGLPDGVIDAGMNLQQLYAKAFENIATAKVATSAVEGMELGYIRKTENISLGQGSAALGCQAGGPRAGEILPKAETGPHPRHGREFPRDGRCGPLQHAARQFCHGLRSPCRPQGGPYPLRRRLRRRDAGDRRGDPRAREGSIPEPLGRKANAGQDHVSAQYRQAVA